MNEENEIFGTFVDKGNKKASEGFDNGTFVEKSASTANNEASEDLFREHVEVLGRYTDAESRFSHVQDVFEIRVEKKFKPLESEDGYFYFHPIFDDKASLVVQRNMKTELLFHPKREQIESALQDLVGGFRLSKVIHDGDICRLQNLEGKSLASILREFYADDGLTDDDLYKDCELALSSLFKILNKAKVAFFDSAAHNALLEEYETEDQRETFESHERAAKIREDIGDDASIEQILYAMKASPDDPRGFIEEVGRFVSEEVDLSQAFALAKIIKDNNITSDQAKEGIKGVMKTAIDGGVNQNAAAKYIGNVIEVAIREGRDVVEAIDYESKNPFIYNGKIGFEAKKKKIEDLLPPKKEPSKEVEVSSIDRFSIVKPRHR